MRTVRSARVHLAMPERSVFVRDTREPTASVFLEVFAGRRLEQEQIASIMNLVAGSVPQMSKDNVTVVDQSGNLLTGQDQGGETQQMEDQYEYTSRVEDRLTRRVASLVRPVVGEGRFRAEVTADLDFSSVEQAEELFNPEQQAVRSERSMTERSSSAGARGIPGALSNQPPADAAVPEQANGAEEGEAPPPPPVNVREESTRNYEMDRTVSYIRQEFGRINRLNVALAVDDMRVVNPDTGEVSYEPWPEAELQRLTMLVRDAVGYSAARGDSVTVMNTAFAAEKDIEYTAPGFWEQPWFWDLMKQVLAGLVILVLILGLLRPTLKSLSGGGQSQRREGRGDDSEGLDGIEGGDALRDAMQSQDDLLLPGATDSYDRQLNALKGLVAEDPARVSQVMRQWVNVDD
jgi:flagellar M-ring protein FliF